MESGSSMSGAKVLKLVIIGDGAVGKTTLTKVFCNNEYIDQIMTIGIDIHAKETLLNKKKVTLQIWDISGQDQFKFLLPDFVKNANGAILAFDRTRPTSFRNLDEWFQLLRTHEPQIPIVLVATKGDLVYHPALNPELAKEFVRSHELIGFEDTSAKAKINIHAPFQRLIEHIHGLTPGSSSIVFLGKDGIPDQEPQPPELTKEEDRVSTFQSNPVRPTAIPILEHSTSGSSAATVSYPHIKADFPSQCPNCGTPLRETQLKLIRNGTRV
jgi:small GTP-binding protein